MTDTLNHRVQKFDSQGHFLAKFGTGGSQPGQFSSPMGIAVDGQGRIYVAERGNSRVQVLDPEGRPLGTFGSCTAPPTLLSMLRSGARKKQLGEHHIQFNEPYGIAIDGQARVFVTDNGAHRVQRLALNPNQAPQ